ncbi:MAG: PAS domain S-box protein, partial [Cytophagaceae bacterium]
MTQENHTTGEKPSVIEPDKKMVSEKIISGNIEKRYEAFFNSASLGMAAADLNSNYLAVNDAYCNLVGYSREELASMNMKEITHPEDISSNLDMLNQLKNNLIPSFELQKRYIHKNGKIIWGRIHVSLLRNDLGEPEGFIATSLDISTEMKMREEQEKLLSLTENSLDLVLLANLDGHITYVNKSGRNLLGIGDNEALHTHIADYFFPEMQQKLTGEILPFLIRKGRWTGQIYCRHFKTGEQIPAHLIASRIDDQQTGEPVAFSGVARDLRPELEARKEQLELLTLLENTSDFVSLSDIHGNVHYVNESGRRLLGISNPEDALRPNRDYVMPEEADRLKNVINKALFENGRWTGETFYRNFSTGEAIPVYGTTMLVYDPVTGNIQGRATTVRDLRQEKAASKALQESSEQLSLAIESAEMGTWSINFLTSEVFFSERVRSWYGFTGATIDFESGFLAIHAEDRERVQSKLQESLSSGSDFYEDEYRIRNLQNGTERIVRPVGKVFFNESGFPYLVRGIVQDVTAQRRTREELERQVYIRTEELGKANEFLKRSNEELEQFAYAASHDMQEPLRKIQTFVSLLLENSNEQLSASDKNYLSKISSAAARMKSIIDDLLNYSNQTRMDVALAPTDLNKVIVNILADLDLLIEQKGALVVYDPLPVILAIPSQMNQLFYNLINNALKFSKEGLRPEISINYKETNEESAPGQPSEQLMEISIRDNGIGFNPGYAQQIFGLFQRLNGRASYSGTGIGLALCKKIIQN